MNKINEFNRSRQVNVNGRMNNLEGGYNGMMLKACMVMLANTNDMHE